jgi:hypothetical protein
MIKIFIPAIKSRVKTGARGFWYSKESAKTYYDYLKVVDYKLSTSKDEYCRQRFFDYLTLLKTSYKQECIAYKNDEVLTIFYNKDRQEVLSGRIYAEVKALRQEIKAALKEYSGITIYKDGNKYFKEVFYKDGIR